MECHFKNKSSPRCLYLLIQSLSQHALADVREDPKQVSSLKHTLSSMGSKAGPWGNKLKALNKLIQQTNLHKHRENIHDAISFVNQQAFFTEDTLACHIRKSTVSGVNDEINDI